MYSKQNINSIEQFLQIDENCIKKILMKEIKKERNNLNEEAECKKRFLTFRKKLLNLKNPKDITDFIIINKKYLSTLFETQLVVIKTDILLKKWKKVGNAILAVNKFKNCVVK